MSIDKFYYKLKTFDDDDIEFLIDNKYIHESDVGRNGHGSASITIYVVDVDIIYNNKEYDVGDWFIGRA